MRRVPGCARCRVTVVVLRGLVRATPGCAVSCRACRACGKSWCFGFLFAWHGVAECRIGAMSGCFFSSWGFLVPVSCVRAGVRGFSAYRIGDCVRSFRSLSQLLRSSPARASSRRPSTRRCPPIRCRLSLFCGVGLFGLSVDKCCLRLDFPLAWRWKVGVIEVRGLNAAGSLTRLGLWASSEKTHHPRPEASLVTGAQ